MILETLVKDQIIYLLQITLNLGGVVLSNNNKPAVHSKHCDKPFWTNEWEPVGCEQSMHVAACLLISGKGGLLKQYGQNG